MRSAIVPILWIASAAAQVAPPAAAPEIRGVVLEAGTNLPLSEAEVSVEPASRSQSPVIAKVTTDGQGAFRVALDKPGAYILRAARNGYSDDGKDGMWGMPSNQSRVTLDKEHPTVEVRLLLARSAELSGMVVDDETGKPLPNFTVYPIQILYNRGGFAEVGGPSVATDSEGRFSRSGLRPGNYLVAIRPQVLLKEQLLAKFSDDDRKTVDHDYARSYWPGGGGLDTAIPVKVLSGGSNSVGTMKARKAAFYRIHLSIPETGCIAGEEVGINATMSNFIDEGGSGTGACGKEYLLRNYEPGRYLLYLLSSGKKPEERRRVLLPVEVTDKNLELTVPLVPGPDLDGRVVVAEGSAKPPLEKLTVRVRTTGDIQFSDQNSGVVPDAEGRFHIPNVPAAQARISVSGLDARFDVKEIRYNGAAISDRMLSLNGSAMSHNVEIVVDDKPARITGIVADGDKPVAKPHLVLVRWPASLADPFLSAQETEGDDGGRFQFTGLAPGEFRILAVRPEAADRLDEPHILERLLRSAERVTLDPGGFQNLSLRVTDPNR